MSVDFSRFSLFKRRNGYYYVLYYDRGRRRWKATGVTTKPEALTVLSHFRDFLGKARAPVSLTEFQDRFLSFAEVNYSPATVDLYRMVLIRFIRLVGDLDISDLTPEHFDRYKAYRMRTQTEFKKQPRPRSAVSVNIELRTLRAAVNTARRWKLVEANPFQDVTLVRVADVAPVFFGTAGFRKLVASIREDWLRDVVMFAVLTGLREGEVLNLRWCDVDLVRRLVTIQTSVTFRTKQGRHRIVPLGDLALDMLRSQQGKINSEHVFTLNSEPISQGYLQHRFKRAILKAGLSKRLHFHNLRHYAEFRTMPSSA